MQGKVAEVRRQFPQRVERALYAEAKIELAETRRRVPVDTGRLRDSGFVATFRRNTVTSVEIAYDTPYAVYVHEDLEAYHPNGQAKFVESVLKESAPYLGERLARRLRL